MNKNTIERDIAIAYRFSRINFDDEYAGEDVQAEFDAWLRSVKAEVWDEGFDSGHYAAEWESRDCDCRKNPYRKED